LNFIGGKNSPNLILIATHNIELLKNIAAKFIIIEYEDIRIVNNNNAKDFKKVDLGELMQD